ncbi:universal stress protein [Dellaglioa sp. P0083]|uniref:universal stress protein n=1 Tax=Dellaglioa kimchii TaxID=3344667 RepID=UPI0038D48AC4
MFEQVYKRVMVGIDGSVQSERAFNQAVESTLKNEASLIVVHVVERSVDNTFSEDEDDVTTEVKRLNDTLADYKQIAIDKGVNDVETILVYGSSKVLLSREIPEEKHVDLIMVGQTGANVVERFVNGSTTDAILRNAPCDVLVISDIKKGTSK